jgi:Tol biopolymer transport system component
VRIGPYEVGDLIGEGGMGRVYRAHDTRLHRDVAIKILPDAFVADSARVARFQREAQLLASLSHPNIAAIYGLEEAAPAGAMSCALVLELVEGPTLADRIAQGPIPPDEALAIARQIVAAIEAAHDTGIIHRDLKPSNVKLRPDGAVKVLDFGLAKMREPPAAAAGLTQSPTVLTASMPGMIVGTAGYMAPEQAKGRDADHRADIWAFGCVLYEMLAGRTVFDGETISEVLAGVLKSEPDWHRLPLDTPENIRRLLRRCLERDVRKRLQHIGDARLELDEPASLTVSVPAHRAPVWRERAAWATAAVLAVAALIAVMRPQQESARPERRLEIAAPGTPDPPSLAVSPDGNKIAYAGNSDQGVVLWLRDLDAAASHPLAGTGNARLPFWSPDSRSIAFFADGKLKRVDLDTGAIRSLTTAVNGFGGTWNRQDLILVAPLATGAIEAIPAAGGEPKAVTRVAPQQQGHRLPYFLPDGRHFLYHASGASPDTRGIYVGQLDNPDASKRLFDADTGAAFAGGFLYFERQGALFAQRFDPDTLSLQSSPQQVAEQVATNTQSSASFSVSSVGVIAYRGGLSAQTARQLAWFDRTGKSLGPLGEPMSAISNLTLSHDDRMVALGRSLNGNVDIWLVDAVRGTPIRLTSDPKIDNFPIWSADGSHVVFESYASGNSGDLYEKGVAGNLDQRLLVSTPEAKFPTDCFRDGTILYQTLDAKTGFDIWAFRQTGDRRPFPVLRTEAEERLAHFSPDGRWIAYESNETGRFEVYVQAFPPAGRKIAISTSGGGQPRWRRDGRELFYLMLDGRLAAVPMTWTGDSIEPAVPTPLFQTQVVTMFGVNGMQYDVSTDGQRFLVSSAAGGLSNNTAPISIVLNWNPKRD